VLKAAEIPALPKRRLSAGSEGLMPIVSDMVPEKSVHEGQDPPSKKTCVETMLSVSSKELRSRRYDTPTSPTFVGHATDNPADDRHDTPAESSAQALTATPTDNKSEPSPLVALDNEVEGSGGELEIVDTIAKTDVALIYSEVLKQSLVAVELAHLVASIEKVSSGIASTIQKDNRDGASSIGSCADRNKFPGPPSSPEPQKGPVEPHPAAKPSPWYPNVNATFSETEVHTPLRLLRSARDSSLEDLTEQSEGSGVGDRASATPDPYLPDVLSISEAIQMHAPFDVIFADAENVLRLLNAHQQKLRCKKVTVKQFYAELYVIATDGMDDIGRLSLLTICLVYKTKAKVLEYLRLLDPVHCWWAGEALAVVEERGRDQFKGDEVELARYLATFPSKTTTTTAKGRGKNKVPGDSATAAATKEYKGKNKAPGDAAVAEPTTAARQTRASTRAAAASGEQGAALVTVGGLDGTLDATKHPDHSSSRSGRPLRAAKVSRKYIVPFTS
jgi:hypothetical protein